MEVEYAEKEKQMLTRHEKERAATEPAEEDKPKEEQTVEKVGEVPKEEEPQERKLTKAQRRKMKERQKQRERDAMLEQAQNEAGPSARDLECQAIQAVLEPKKLTIQEVASDGHCLYRAIGEQCRLNYQDVRSKCADMLQQHAEEYSPFAELKTDMTYEDYVVRVRSSADWGGQLEIQALSLALERPLVVYSATSPPITMGEHFAENAGNNAIHLSYHRHYYALGEHYNKVVPKVVTEE
mmetsp:Transcript_6142/g.9335  ORF Transcript_6142/g.9335 Transcript_6142/m.9335 type:complete len:239 (-) Transcript_6142:115-831(-)|eukprot:CAMPEP_0118719866 /NCGR_PEP_ID=MMETSP0800-20121206/29767_1 /TAXON_ID=210618 ORGANISM="Striatella unipunctata, Strain CCMP2910" /NCGR_SAMPLE_ID=MMETSP0800 /ASSEMBLY_ACC=CAM_ASM_000638 /LENGTH=238 /DNA_ID=CAMNT_0006627391 /DNA_START=199 /DNA_END=915 /DNA_ORIENTATION=-